MKATLGRVYSLHILDILQGSEESTFKNIIDELGISPNTLSHTLKDLVEEGLVDRRVYGRSSYYSITDKGKKAFKQQRKGPQFDIDRMTQLVAKRLREKGVLEKYQVPNEQLMQAIRKKVQRFMDEVGESLNIKGGV